MSRKITSPESRATRRLARPGKTVNLRIADDPGAAEKSLLTGVPTERVLFFHRLSMGPIRATEPDFLPGTLEMLILQTLSRSANHGYGIAQHIQQISKDALKIGEGSLYPALQRLLMNDYVVAEWGLSENNRRARFYKITATGRKQLAQEKRNFGALLAGIARVMEAS